MNRFLLSIEQYWLHPKLKSDIYRHHLGKYFLVANLLAVGFITPLIVLCYFLNFKLGVIACIAQVTGHLLSLLHLRYSKKIGLNCYLVLSNFAVVLLIMSIGVGSMTSIFSIYYVILIWFAFYYDFKLGMLWTSGLILWLIFWILAESRGIVKFELGMSVSNFILFKYLYMISSLLMAALIFCANKLNENRLRHSLESSRKAMMSNEKLASLGHLTAGIAHEMNNPINFISGNAQALDMDFDDLMPMLQLLENIKEDPEDLKTVNELIKLVKSTEIPYLLTEIKSLIEGINKGSDRVTAIVSGLRMFAHQSDEKFQEYSIVKIVESALIMLANKLELKGVRVVKHYSDLDLISCLPGKLQQVFINIIDNSIDAIQSHGNIDISIAPMGENIVIIVRDDGRGMNQLTLGKMFDPFYTTKEVGEGTGLGLSISHGIIKDHGGDIHVKSSIDQGTVVTISLPNYKN